MRTEKDRPRGLGGLLRRLEWKIGDASMKWRFGHAMRRPHAPPEPGPHPMVMVCDGLYPRHNIGRIIRSAEIFGAREVHLINSPLFDPAPATTALHRIPVRHFARREACFDQLRRDGYTLVVIETLDDPGPEQVVQTATMPERAALVVGNETHGIAFRREDHPDARWMTIRMWGQTACLDVATSAGIAMYEWTRQRAGTFPAS